MVKMLTNFDVFGVNNSESLSILIANKIFNVTVFFTYLLLRSICSTRNSSQQTWMQCLSSINVVFSDENKILIKSLHLKRYTAKTLTDEFPEKSWRKRGVNKLLKKLWYIGTIDGATKRSHNNWLPTFYQKITSLRMLNIFNILQTHKYTQHTQLHT